VVVAADGAETLLDEGEEGALLLLGEVGGDALGTAVDGADTVTQVRPYIDYFLYIVLADRELLLHHVGVRVCMAREVLMNFSTWRMKTRLILDIITLLRSRQSRQFILGVLANG
jgi:hypothetical protein